MHPGVWLAAWILFVCLCERTGVAADPALKRTAWLTVEETRRPGVVRITWAATPLREALRNLSQSQRLAILLDRRVDPEQLVSITLDNVSPAEAIEQLAVGQKLGAALFGPLAYIGPAKPTRQIRTLAALRKQEAQQLPTVAKQAALASRATAWEDLATPREILDKLAAEANIKLAGLEQVPHDLWGAAELPPMAWTDRLTAVAAPLGLTFEFDKTGRRVTLIPIDEQPQIERSYPGGANPTKLASGWRAIAPDARIEVADGRVVVRGLIEDHERIQPPKAPPRPTKGEPAGKKVQTIRVDDITLESLLRQLEERLSIHFEYDPKALAAAGAPLSRVVSLDVKKATLDELLTAIFDPLGLRFERDGTTIKVTAP
ncbi:MAG TPA: STN domain-containing protein [Pirellulales bacterium]